MTTNDKIRIVKKGWGSETIWADTDSYCGKLLTFDKDSKFSCHFHAVKDETWFVLTGKFKLLTIDTNTSKQSEILLNPGDVWHNPPLLPHQLICIEAGTIIEVSTTDNSEDNYRVLPGDSQLS